MLTKMKSLTAFALLSFAVGMPTHAATLGVPNFTTNVVINGGTYAVSGVIDQQPSSNDWIINITTPYDATTTFANIDPGNPPESGGESFTYELFECSACGGNYSSLGGPQNGTFVALLLASNDYFVRIGGTTATGGYRVNVSAVPLPAAALLFLSGLAGFGLLSRGKKESTGSLTV